MGELEAIADTRQTRRVSIVITLRISEQLFRASKVHELKVGVGCLLAELLLDDLVDDWGCAFLHRDQLLEVVSHDGCGLVPFADDSDDRHFDRGLLERP